MHRHEQTRSQPNQLLQGPVTEKVNTLVHHMTSNASDKTERKRRELRITKLPALPAPPQCADQKRQVS
jgi:hypothetical protein